MISLSSLRKKTDILPWIRFYRDLMRYGMIKKDGAAYKRLKRLEERYKGLI